jgi:hypothetical protein
MIEPNFRGAPVAGVPVHEDAVVVAPLLAGVDDDGVPTATGVAAVDAEFDALLEQPAIVTADAAATQRKATRLVWFISLRSWCMTWGSGGHRRVVQ